MKRLVPGTKCEGCKRLLHGTFSWKCRVCAYRYSGEKKESGVYLYRNALLTIPEWAILMGVSKQAAYAQFDKTGTVEGMLIAMRKKEVVDALLGVKGEQQKGKVPNDRRRA